MHVYIVSYDITDDGRRNDVFKYLRRWGDHLQYSVFRCELSATDRAELRAGCRERINCDTDQVLVFDLGPPDGRGRTSVESIGLKYTHPERHAVVA